LKLELKCIKGIHRGISFEELLPEMFEAAVSKFVKSVGHESLIGVPNLDEANQCRPFSVIVKKNRRWSWQSPKYEPTPFKLHQLLTVTDSLEEDVTVNTRKLTMYNKSYKFAVSGKIGAKLKILLDAEMSGSDTVDVEAKFGDVNKVEVDQPKLMQHLRERSLDIKHEYIEQVRQNPNKVLCVVVGCAEIAEEGAVCVSGDKQASESIDIPKPVAQVVDINESSSVDDKSEKKLTIPAETPLAYNVCELLVKANGQLELMIEEGCNGGFQDGDATDGQTSLNDPSADHMYAPLINMLTDKRNHLVETVLAICEQPADVESLLLIMKKASRLEVTDSPELVDLKNLQDQGAAMSFLLLASFKSQDDGSLSYPGESSPVFNALRALLEALMELDDEATENLSKCKEEDAGPLLYVLHSFLEGKLISLKDAELANMQLETEPARVLLTSLGITADNEGKLTCDPYDRCQLEGAYRAVYALWVEPAEKPKPPPKPSCTLL